MQEKAAKIAQVESFLKRVIVECENHQQPWIDLASEVYDLIDGRVATDSETDVHINTVGTAYERIKAELVRGIANFDKWRTVEHAVGSLQDIMTPLEANRGIDLLLDGTNPRTSIVDMMGHFLVENRSGLKLHVSFDKKPGQKRTVSAKWIPLNFNNYMCDPADPECPLYEIFISYLPKFKVRRLPNVYQTVVDSLAHYEPSDSFQRLSNEGDIDGTVRTAKQTRKDIRVMEFWGTVLDDNGDVLEWEEGFPLENVQIICANDGVMLADPVRNKRYSGRSPMVTSALLRSGKSPYRPGLLVNGAELNKHMNVILSSMITGGIKASHNVTAVQTKYLKDPAVLANGLEPNMTLELNEDAPLGAKIFESEKLGEVSPEQIQVYQLVRQLGGENMFASDQFMTGNARSSDTATAQIQSQNVIGGLFEALDSVLEDNIIEVICQETFQAFLQHKNKVSDEDLLYVFNGDVERARRFKELPEKEVLSLLGTAFKFRGKGLRSRAASKAKANAFIQFASMIMGNPVVAQQFMDAYSFKTFISKGLEGLEIDPEELQLSEREYDLIMHRKMIEQEVAGAMALQGQTSEAPAGASEVLAGAANPSDFNDGQQSGQAF